MSVLGTVLTINTHFTSALSVLPNLLVIYLALTTGINEIPEYRFIIIVQAFNEILNSVTLSIIDMGGYKCPRCGGRELVFLNTTYAVKHLEVRHEAEYAQVVQELKHRKQPVKRAAPSTTPEES
ncbi:hypothetical protein Tcan_08738 [Toxocara canis]|uniref:Uncharacterized protein n=1 Tax=Toxocara canis TaxID=6265 RepID=A0A0B2VBI0_TOXCA|nr:hypothetical protein Tcan_08738 [Toxocara canis]